MIIAGCLICLEIFVNKDNLSVLSCGHIYHQKCLGKWFSTKKSCPSCRCTQGNKKYVEKIFFDVIDDPSLTNIQNYNETEALLNSKITKLQMENRVLLDKITDINQTNDKNISKLNLENNQLNKKNQVIHSLNKSISKTLETIRAENCQILSQKSIVEEDVLVLKNEIKKLNFINEMLKDETGEFSEKVKSIQMSNDINSQIDMISSALVISHKNKNTVDENNAKLQKDLKNVMKINHKFKLKIAKLEENLQTLENEEKCSKIQLAELEKHFKTPNVNISMPIRKETVLINNEIEIDDLDNSFNNCSSDENSFTDSSRDLSPGVSFIKDNDNPFPIVSFKKLPVNLLNKLSIMRKSLNTVTNQIPNATPKSFESPIYNDNSNKNLKRKQSNSDILRNLKRKIVDSQTAITKYFKS